MYSSLQQQCLVELGVIPYDLNDNYKTRLQQSQPEQTTHIKNDTKSVATEQALTKSSPEVADSAELVENSTTLQHSVKASSPHTLQQPQIENYWLTSPERFINDIKLIFPSLKFELLPGHAHVAVLQDAEGKKVVWALNPNILAVQSEVIENITVISSPVPSSLTAMDKKHLWALIKPYSNLSD